MTAEQRVKAEALVTRTCGYVGVAFRYPGSKAVDQAVSYVLTTIVREGPEITALDKRPHEGWTPEQPEVFFPYVQQCLLEWTIDDLKSVSFAVEAKDVHAEVIRLLEERV
jgi:hypothetical protein